MGRQLRRALRLSRAMRCHAIVPGVVTYGAAISGCDKCQQSEPKQLAAT